MRGAVVSIVIASGILTACEAYPPADAVVACAGARVEGKQGVFSVEKGPSSMFFGTEHSITYQKDGSPDRAVVLYTDRQGPVTTRMEISYGNYAEITTAVDAIKVCAQAR